jgi:hypothetical protein
MGLNLWLPEEVEHCEADPVLNSKEEEMMEGSQAEDRPRGADSDEITTAGKTKIEPEEKV